MPSLQERYDRTTAKLKARRAARDRQAKREQDAERRREEAQRRRKDLLAQLDRTTDPVRIAELKLEIHAQHKRARRAKHTQDQAGERLQELGSKIAWGVKRQTTLRKKLNSADPTPQAWHGNGHEWNNLTPRAKDLLAVAVVKYGLYCTSITRGWGTGSFHEDVPTRGFDCAGARMTEFQKDLRYGRIKGFSLRHLLELFGPDNAACADNGSPYAMVEGSAIENLHYNHVHAFLY